MNTADKSREYLIEFDYAEVELRCYEEVQLQAQQARERSDALWRVIQSMLEDGLHIQVIT